MDCTVKWTGEGMSFLAETGSNHALIMDGAPEAGGRNLAPRPMELLLAGTGGCTAFDVVMILKKGRHAISGCEVSLKAERAETEPIETPLFWHLIENLLVPLLQALRVTGEGLEAPIVVRFKL